MSLSMSYIKEEKEKIDSIIKNNINDNVIIIIIIIILLLLLLLS